MVAAMDRTVWRISAAYAVAFTAGPISITAGPLLGRELAPDPALATLPLAVQLLCMMAAGVPASWLMARIGRRLGFQVGMLVGGVGGLLVAFSPTGGFAWLLVGSACIGVHLGFTQLFRFAATDLMPDQRAQAVGTVLVGGVVAAVLGPFIVVLVRGEGAPAYATAYGSIAALAALCMLLIQTIEFAPLTRPGAKKAPLRSLLRLPIVTGVGAAMIGYGAMSLLMTATPLAMSDAGFGIAATATIIVGHGLAMFAPSFATGRLIEQYGVNRILAVGWAALLGAAIVSVASTSLVAFGVALVLLGLGWNGLFVGGTTLVASHQRPGEGPRLQGINDLFVLGSGAAGTLLSGVAMERLGWGPAQVWLGASLVAVGGLLWFGLRRVVTAATKPVPVRSSDAPGGRTQRMPRRR